MSDMQTPALVFGDSLNELLSAHLARLDDDQRTIAFGSADDMVREAVQAGGPVDLLRLMQQAIAHADPAMDDPELDPTS